MISKSAANYLNLEMKHQNDPTTRTKGKLVILLFFENGKWLGQHFPSVFFCRKVCRQIFSSEHPVDIIHSEYPLENLWWRWSISWFMSGPWVVLMPCAQQWRICSQIAHKFQLLSQLLTVLFGFILAAEKYVPQIVDGSFQNVLDSARWLSGHKTRAGRWSAKFAVQMSLKWDLCYFGIGWHS